MPRPDAAWTRRKAAASRYRPTTIRLLIVGESPPADPETYLYFDGPRSIDALFENLVDVVLDGETPDPEEKPVLLKELKRRGIFVADLKPDRHRENEPLGPYVDWLHLSLADLAPEHVVLVGSDVDAAARKRLVDEGVPVVDAQVPDPGRSPLEFRQALRTALVRAGLESLIRPRPAIARARKAAAKAAKTDAAPEPKPRRSVKPTSD